MTKLAVVESDEKYNKRENTSAVRRILRNK